MTPAAEPVSSSPVEMLEMVAHEGVQRVVETRKGEKQPEPQDTAGQGVADRGEPAPSR